MKKYWWSCSSNRSLFFVPERRKTGKSGLEGHKGLGPSRPNAHGLSLVPGGDGILSSPRHIHDSRGIVHLLSLPVFSIWCRPPAECPGVRAGLRATGRFFVETVLWQGTVRRACPSLSSARRRAGTTCAAVLGQEPERRKARGCASRVHGVSASPGHGCKRTSVF